MKVRNELESQLRQRAREEEQAVDDVIERLLHESEMVLSLEEAIRTAADPFDHIDAITVGHATGIDITVYTTEADERSTTIDTISPKDTVLIKGDQRTVETELTAVATQSSPEVWDSKSTTTVYVSDSVRGVDPVEIEDGISYLEAKLRDPDHWSTNNSSDLDEIRGYPD